MLHLRSPQSPQRLHPEAVEPQAPDRLQLAYCLPSRQELEQLYVATLCVQYTRGQENLAKSRFLRFAATTRVRNP